MRGSETPYPIWIKFCKVVDIPYVITSANFGEDRLRGLGVARGQSLPFSIDYDRCPYNILALLCECVIYQQFCDSDHQASNVETHSCCLTNQHFWSYSMWHQNTHKKTFLHIFKGRTPFLWPNQQCQSTQGKSTHWSQPKKSCTGLMFLEPLTLGKGVTPSYWLSKSLQCGNNSDPMYKTTHAYSPYEMCQMYMQDLLLHRSQA